MSYIKLLESCMDKYKELDKKLPAKQQLVTHPCNAHLINNLIREHRAKDAGFTHIIADYSIAIVYNEYLEKEKWTGRWIRRSVMPDDRFTTWVSDEDLLNPSSWQIFFGLVQKEMEPIFYILEVPSVVAKGNRTNEFLVHSRPTFQPQSYNIPMPKAIQLYS